MNNINLAAEILINEWPEPEQREYIRAKRGNVELSIGSTYDGGHFYVNGRATGTDGNKVVMFYSQRIEFASLGMISLVADISDDGGLVVFINGNQLLPESAAPETIFKVEAKPLLGDLTTSYPPLLPDRAKTKDEKFFLETIIDLKKRSILVNNYELLKIAGLLRLLLLDNPCLVDLINKSYKLKLLYQPFDKRMSSAGNKAEPLEVFGEDDVIILPIYDSLIRGDATPLKNRNSFIKTPCAYMHGKALTIEDMILVAANKAGGIHYDPSKPSKASQAKFLELSDSMEIRQMSLIAYMMRSIALLTLEGVKPLVSAIQ